MERPTTITQQKGKYYIVSSKHSDAFLVSFVLILLLVLMFDLSSRVFTGVKDIETKNAINTCSEATWDGGPTCASPVPLPWSRFHWRHGGGRRRIIRALLVRLGGSGYAFCYF